MSTASSNTTRPSTRVCESVAATNWRAPPSEDSVLKTVEKRRPDQFAPLAKGEEQLVIDWS